MSNNVESPFKNISELNLEQCRCLSRSIHCDILWNEQKIIMLRGDMKKITERIKELEKREKPIYPY